jgi:hypothetical protein
MLGEQKSGLRYNLTALDLKAFDAIGYKISTQSLISLTQSSTALTNLQIAAQAYATTATIADRSANVQQMKTDSITYAWGWNGYWEEANDTEVATLPQPASIVGLLGITLLGIISQWWMRRR